MRNLTKREFFTKRMDQKNGVKKFDESVGHCN